jgi:hypothetical protein
MIRTLQVSFVILAAVLLAACSHLRMARQALEYRGFLEEWGVHKPDPFNPNHTKHNG